jgi:hypothetical protein
MAVKLLDASAGTIGGTYNTNGTRNPDSVQKTFFCWGTFAEAAVYIEYSPDGVEWFRDKTEESKFIEKDLRTLKFAPGVHIRAAIVGATASTLLNLWMM